MCCSKEVVMNQKSALNKESYASCLIVGIMALLCLFPFWVAVVNSFASENSVTLSGYSIIPKELSLDGYKYLLNNKGIMLLRSFGISFLIVIVGTAYTMFVTVCFAYAISQDRKDFPPANVLSFFSWFTTVFSGGVIPWYILCTRYYGLYNNLWALFIPSALNVFNMFVIRNSFKAIPKDLIEAARIDGASNLRIFLSIGLPLAKVGLVTIGLFTLLGYWNDFQLSLYLVNNSELFPVQKMLYTMMANISFLVSGSVDSSSFGAGYGILHGCVCESACAGFVHQEPTGGRARRAVEIQYGYKGKREACCASSGHVRRSDPQT